MLSADRLGAKRARYRARRKKIGPVHSAEHRRLGLGDPHLPGQIHRRKLKDNRNHHRKMNGENRRSSNEIPQEV